MKLLYRKFYRLSALSFVLLYSYTNKFLTLGVLTIFIGILFFFEYLRFKNRLFNEMIFRKFSSYLKEEEKKKISSTTTFFVVMFLLIFLFSKEVALISLSVMIISDTISALAGSYWGRVKLVKGKTLEGSLSFFLSCIGIGFIFRLLGFNFSWLAIFSSAFLCSMVELIPYFDDNISVPFVSAIVFEVLKKLGW